jgi:hypothetical protein
MNATGTSSGHTALGVHLAAGEAYIGIVRPPADVDTLDPLEKMAPAGHLSGADQLADFVARFRQEVRRVHPDVVGVLLPRRGGQWVYKEAAQRASLEACILLAGHAEGIASKLIKQSDVASGLHMPPEKVPQLAAERLGVTKPPRYWRARSYAFAAAAYLAQETATS